MFITIKENVSASLIEKKSKFIAEIFYVQTEQDVINILKNVKKKYYDAKHHCFAYSILQAGNIINKLSDDGEPSGTAGSPILNILTKKNIVNVLVVVTRYFGGVLLGTGGLVKAYTDSTLLALNKTVFVQEVPGVELELILNYANFEKFQYFAKKNNISITKIDYNEKITCIIEIGNEEKNKIFSLNENENIEIQKISILQEKFIKKSVDI